jgi:UDP-N-acetylmuramoyl-tripeptide--D-alanyl-D-alanine ligase
LAEPLRAAQVDYAVLVGAEMQSLADELGKSAGLALGKVIPFAHCHNPDEALAVLVGLGLKNGDAVLIKGSNSVGLGAVVAALTDGKG